MTWILPPLAGLVASAINAAVGSGALVAFPILLTQGLSPQELVIALTLGLAPGTLAGAWGYRRELKEVGAVGWVLFAASAIGGVIGAILLVWLDPTIFSFIIPVLLVFSCLLMMVQPYLARRYEVPKLFTKAWLQTLFCLLAGIYGALVGAGQGIILLALLLMLGRELQPANALKNLLLTATNVISAVVLIFTAPIPWALCAMIAVGAALGGHFGSTVARRLPVRILRATVVSIGLATAIWLALSARG